MLLALVLAANFPASDPVSPQDAQTYPPQAYVQQPARVLPTPPLMQDRHVGIHVGVNLGLFAIDVQAKHFYALVAGNAAIPLLTDGGYGSFTALIGYTTDIRRTWKSAWKLDLTLQVTPGFFEDRAAFNPVTRAFVGVGAAVGFRYELRGGFSFALRIPAFGYAIGNPGRTAGGVGQYYLASLVSLPIISFGYRF